VCGDVAADPVLAPFFVGIGIRKLSVSPARVEGVKRRLADMERYLEGFDRRHPGRLGPVAEAAPVVEASSARSR